MRCRGPPMARPPFSFFPLSLFLRTLSLTPQQVEYHFHTRSDLLALNHHGEKCALQGEKCGFVVEYADIDGERQVGQKPVFGECVGSGLVEIAAVRINGLRANIESRSSCGIAIKLFFAKELRHIVGGHYYLQLFVFRTQDFLTHRSDSLLAGEKTYHGALTRALVLLEQGRQQLCEVAFFHAHLVFLFDEEALQ